MRAIAILLAFAPAAAIVADAASVAAQPYDTEYIEDDDDGSDVGVNIAIDAELFGGGSYTSTDDDHMTRFDLDRGEVGIRLDYGDVVSAELRLETFRPFPAPEVRGDAMPEGDDALTIRAKRAWGAWKETRHKRRSRPRFEVRGGLIPEPWIEAIEGEYELRALAPTAAEHAGLIDHSDIGLATVAIWKMLRLQVALTNGEGGVRPELNRGKNVSGILSARMPGLPGDLVVATHFYGRRGSQGSDPVRSHRVGTAVTVDSPRFGGGAELVSAIGVGDRDDLNAMTTGLWGYATLSGRTGLAMRFDWISMVDELDQRGKLQTSTIAVWRDLVARGASRVRDFGVRAYLAAQFDRASDMPAMAGQPGPVDATRFMIIIQASARETVE